MSGTGATPVVSGTGAVAIGVGQTANGNGAVAIGDPNTANGTGAVAIGADNNATGNGAVAIGNANTAGANGAVALGNAANAAQANAVALGSGATTTRAGQIALGGTGSSVRVGDIAASTAAQVGPTDIATVDASGTLGRDTTIRPALASLQSTVTSQGSSISAIQAVDAQQTARLSSLETGQAALGSQVIQNNREANAGIAAAMAMGGVVMPSGANYSVSFNLATYRGQQGFSGSAVQRVSEKVYFSAGIAGSTVKGSTGGRAGFTVAW